MTQDIYHTAGHIVKDAPPVAVGGIVLFGVELSEWVLILTIVYTIIRILVEVSGWWARRKHEQSIRSGTQ